MQARHLQAGHCYSNGTFGNRWEVRLLTAISPNGAASFKALAGEKRRRQGECPLQEFAAWAVNEVRLNENSWERVEPQDGA
jgi:hypothetical protein